MDSRTLRKRFAAGLFTGLRIVWPILSVLFRADRHVRRGCRLGRRLIRAGIDLLLFRIGIDDWLRRLCTQNSARARAGYCDRVLRRAADRAGGCNRRKGVDVVN